MPFPRPPPSSCVLTPSSLPLLPAFHPAPSARQTTQQVRNLDGSFSEVDVLTRRMPTTLEDWMEACRVYYHSLMMVATQHNEHPRLLPDWETLKDFYERFLFGSRVAKRRIPPTVGKLVYLERQAWNQIIEKLWEHKNMTITTALEELQGDSLWWTNELSNSTTTPTPNSPNYNNGGRNGKGGYRGKGGKAMGRGRYQQAGRSVIQQTYNKGKGKKGKGKGKNGKRNDLQYRNNAQQQGSSTRPPPPPGGGNWNNNNSNRRQQNSGGQIHPKVPRQNWVQRPNGISFCENYHIYGTCQDGRNCTREHICPGCGQGVHPLHACRNC